jgi:hypothetical protein
VQDTYFQAAVAGSPATLSAALQARREFVKREIQDVCLQYAKPKILSVGNGQMREAEGVFALCQHRGGEFVALDQDVGQRWDLVCREYELQSVRKLEHCLPSLPSSLRENEFHYIYSLNVLAELDDQRARTLVSGLFSKLKRGGILLLSSFAPEADRFEAIGAVHRRSEAEMMRLATVVPSREMIGHAIWRDDSEAIVYLEIRK